MSTYKSRATSPEKDWARLVGYLAIKKYGKLYGKWHLVIASRECGDIHLLHKWKQNKIIACDLDPAALREANKLPNVIIAPHADVRDAVRWAIDQGYDLGSINVDLCFGLIGGLPILKPILEIATCPVIFTYCRREGKVGPELLGYKLPSTPANVQKLRERYMFRVLGIKPVIHELYESDSEHDYGSHMAVCVFNTPKDKPKRGALKEYNCPSCRRSSHLYHPTSNSMRQHLVKCLPAHFHTT